MGTTYIEGPAPPCWVDFPLSPLAFRPTYKAMYERSSDDLYGCRMSDPPDKPCTTSRVKSALTKDEGELLRGLLVALTKFIDTNENDALENNPSEKDLYSMLGDKPVFARHGPYDGESDVESTVSDFSEKKEYAAKAKETVTDMRAKHAGFLRRCDDLEYGLGHLISSFLSVGGTRAVIRASTETRAFLKDVKRHSQDWIPFETHRMKTQGTVLHKTLSALADASFDLSDCLINFECYHGLLLQEFRDWEWCLRGGVITIVRLLDEKDYHCLNTFVFESLMPELSLHMERISQKLKALVSLTLPPIQSAENNATSRYLYMTTIATFFSGVTATTLQFSYSQTGSALNSAVNLFWLLSLVFSVSSAINSLLGMTWRKSSIAPPTFRLPRLVALWLDVAPMLFLFISAFTFAVGLAIFSFASRQSTLVSVFITTFVVLHILGLFILSVWFLAEVEKDTVAFLRRFIQRILFGPFHGFFAMVRQASSDTIKSLRRYANSHLESLRTASMRFRSCSIPMGSDLEAANEKTPEGETLPSEAFQTQGAEALQLGVTPAEKVVPMHIEHPTAIIDRE